MAQLFDDISRALTVSLLLAGCASGTPTPSGERKPAAADSAVAPLLQPTVRMISPPTWAAGDVITLLGQEFAEPARGQTRIELRGHFTSNGGDSRAVEMSVLGTYRSAGRVDFTFEPAYPPLGFGQELGAFVGEVTAINFDETSESKAAEPLAASVTVAPSLAIWSVGPVGGSCAERRIEQTVDGAAIEVEVEAIGLIPATSYTPLQFAASFVDLNGDVQELTQSAAVGRGARFEIDPKSLPAQQMRGAVAINVMVTDGDGVTLQRSFDVGIVQPYAVDYDGNVRVRELYQPVLVSSCLPGGEYGRNVSYSGSQSESRSRSVGMSVNVGVSAWVLTAGFGMDVSASVSSSTSESLSMSGNILPGQYGVFYRQTERLERLGALMHFDACGVQRKVGEARVTDWNWAPDLAVTTNGQCPPAPPSNLPVAQVMP